MEMLADINKDTVDFGPNFDETEKEPLVLPSRFPNLLVNGTTGIAVGMATNIPPHNLRETINGVLKIIENRIDNDRETEIEEILNIIKGPDFPTGAMILGKNGINEAYRTGRGKIKVRAVTEIEPMGNGRQRIVVTELPYMVNKSKLIEKIAELVRDKRVEGISDLRDESSREGMRVVIELKKDANPNIVLNHLYKHTQLQDTFGVILLALVNNEPMILNLKQILELYLKHQEEVITRRSQYELNKAEERAHILEGLLIALDNIDEVIHIIRSSKNVAEAKEKLIQNFSLTDVQAQAIVDMRLRALTGLEREKLEGEYAELEAKIADLKAILGDEKRLLGVIRDEITIIRDKYGDDRRTSIGIDDEEITIEDLIKKENTVIAMTKLGYIKRMTVDNFRSQNRGGKGIKGMSTLEDDFIEEMLMTSTHHYIMFFTNKGKAYRIKAYQIPESSRIARGTAIINILQLEPGEKITAMIPIHDFDQDVYLFMATRKGIVKKTSIKEYDNIRKTGIISINLRDDDELIEVKTTTKDNDIFLVTRNGKCIRFNEQDVRPTGRTSMGVIGMTLDADDEIIGMQLDTQGDCLLIASENGMGKRTAMDEFNRQHRGGKGVLCYNITDKTGNVIGAKAVNDGQEIMMITSGGIVIRMPVDNISKIGRYTSGVKLMDIDVENDIKVASIAKVRDADPEEKNDEETDGEVE
jgi:DNA gyrase subunit A